VYLPPGFIWLVSNLTIPPGRMLYGPGSVKVAAGADFGVALGSGSVLDGPTVFESAGGFTGHAVRISAGSAFARVENATVRISGSSSIGVSIEAGATDPYVSRTKVFRTAGTPYAGILLRGTIRASVVGCMVDGPTYGVFGFGYRDSIIANNKCTNNVIGIGALSQRAQHPTICSGNTITGNAVYNASEESISLDSTGNEPAQWPENGTLPVATVASAADTSGARCTITISETTGASNWCNGYMLIVLSGSAAGTCAEIEASTSNTIGVSRSGGFDAAMITAGTKLQITLPFINNSITGNTVQSATDSSWGIRLYGACWHNVVANNTVTTMLPPLSCNSVVDDTLGSSGAWKAASWSGFNSFVGNTIRQHKANTASTYGPIWSDVYGLGTPWVNVSYLAKAYAHFRNVFRGNHIAGGARPFFRGAGTIIEDNILAGSNGIYTNNAINSRLFGNINSPSNNVGVYYEEGTTGTNILDPNAVANLVKSASVGTGYGW